jgi:hypothetical protein
MRKDDSVYLHHILMAIERIEEDSEVVSLSEFLKTGIVQDGVVRHFSSNSDILGCQYESKGLRAEGISLSLSSTNTF